MKKIVPILVIGLFILSGFGAVALNDDKISTEKDKLNDNERAHTVFAEYGTATWCGYCKYAHGALKEIYADGIYDMLYVSLVDDKNPTAAQRNDEYNIYGFPTVWFDGGYKVNVGAGSVAAAKAAYISSITASNSRPVPDIDITLDVEWLGSAQMNIDVTVDNYETGVWDGNLRVYVCEIVSSMGWIDTAGYPYTFPFLNYAFNEDINIAGGSSWSDSTLWDGNTYGYGSIAYGNIMVIAAAFNSTWNQGYSYPPSSNPFDAYYVDDATGFALADNVPPNQPSDPDPSDGETGVDLDANLYWTGGDPNPGDDVTYDVYFGTTSTPDLVSSGQSSTSYDPGTMDYETDYYWKIVAWDDSGESTEGPVWEFTTSLDPNPAPEPPTINGPTSGSPNKVYMFKFSAVDPNGDDVYFYIDWGDDTYDEWIGPFDSGVEGSATHCWYEEGTFVIKAKAKDTHGAESDWTILEISMPVSHSRPFSFITTFLNRLIERFPIIEQIISNLQLLLES
jgi:thiol-disulfide isomerase/thioredoxin